MTQVPSVCRWVHYVSYGTPGGEYTSQCRAAVITEVADPNFGEGETRVGLAVVNPTGLFFHSLADGGCDYHAGDVGHDHTGAEIPQRSYPGGTWHWPERVEDG